jgi:hypothetical protein
MEVSKLTAEQRRILHDAFTVFRVGYNEDPDADYSNRDALQSKLQTGSGDLDSTDIHLLGCAIAQEIPGEDAYNWLYVALGSPLW